MKVMDDLHILVIIKESILPIKVFFPKSYPEYPILTHFFLVKGQKWLRYRWFWTQIVAFRDFYEPDRSLYEPDRNLYEPDRYLYERGRNLYEPDLNFYC